jgi:superoxide reductase
MKRLGEYVQSADWKSEKHAPVIECPDRVQAGAKFQIGASVGKEIAHPNTAEHHIAWIELYFQPEGEKFTQQLAANEFVAHGASAKGSGEGPALTEPAIVATVTLKQSGTIHAVSYCNIHGLWESVKEITVS